MKISKLQRIILYIFFFSINFEVYDVTGQGFLSVAKISGFLYFLTIILDSKGFFKTTQIKTVLQIIWCFFAYLTFINFLNVNDVNFQYFSFPIFQNIILFWLLINHERKDPGILQKGLLAFALGSICLTIFYNFGIGVDADADGRVTLFGDNENTVGIRIVVSIIVILTLIIQNVFKFGKWRFILLAFIPIMLLLMANTGSRVSFLSIGVAFILGTLLIRTRGPIVKVITLLIAVVIGLVAWNFMMKIDVLKYRLEIAADGNLAGRNYIWSKIFPLIEDHLLLGVGQTGYELYSTKIFGQVASPHNVIIEILAYTGLIGFIIYLIWLCVLIKNAFKYYFKTGLIIQVILFIPVIGLILSGQILNAKLAWIVFAFAASRVFYNNTNKINTQNHLDAKEGIER